MPLAETIDNEIRKTDEDAKKLTTTHTEVTSLDIPPMTTAFRVKDVAMLDKVQTCDKIRFAVEKPASGFLGTGIQPAL